jgi:hypothetical protein
MDLCKILGIVNKYSPPNPKIRIMKSEAKTISVY